MSDDFRDEDKKENEEINENDDKEIIVDGLPKTTDLSNEQNVYIEDEIKSAYLDYSMSVIVSRALPDVRDGLKPVHRRILFAMNEMGMSHKTPFKKSARIVGDVLGKYHPHGDSSVYGAMVRMAQDFNMRYELIDGHGNFGSIDGDEAAAMRYTEARMAKITEELLADIGKDTIDYRKNFDESLDEPVVLPAKLPNLLLNGANGIAVGMATNIPPHNLGEVVDGIVALIDNPEISIDELIGYIKGPDFPTGGIINGRQGIYDAYRTGRGKLIVAGRVEIEKAKKLAGYNLIVTSELSMTSKEIYDTYHNLWRIEESFRAMKSQLDARPVYLQKQDSIIGHFLICYLAVLLSLMLQIYILEDKYGTEEIFNFIRDFKVAKISDYRYINLTRSSEFIKKLAMNTKLPLTLYFLNNEDINKMLSHRF